MPQLIQGILYFHSSATITSIPVSATDQLPPVQSSIKQETPPSTPVDIQPANDVKSPPVTGDEPPSDGQPKQPYGAKTDTGDVKVEKQKPVDGKDSDDGVAEKGT